MQASVLASRVCGPLLQLGRTLGGRVVRGEKFNSILEGTPTIALAVTRYLKEADGSVPELRKLVIGDENSSTALFRAYQVGSVDLRQQAEITQSTVGQVMTWVSNNLVTSSRASTRPRVGLPSGPSRRR